MGIGLIKCMYDMDRARSEFLRWVRVIGAILLVMRLLIKFTLNTLGIVLWETGEGGKGKFKKGRGKKKQDDLD